MKATGNGNRGPHIEAGRRPPTVSRISGVRGAYMRFEHWTDDELLSAGLVTQDMLPGQRYKCARRGVPGNIAEPYWEIHRCKDGTLNARFDADHVLKRDRAFKSFLGGILADTRLSLVRFESPSA